MISENFKTILGPSLPVGSTIPVNFSEVASIIGPRVRVSAIVIEPQKWFIQMNPVNPSTEAEWFTAPSSQQVSGVVFYDSSQKATTPKWWRAIRKA